ncbi:MAG: PBP1A family penicillin-binding protein [Verrucomicrobiales bacterium]|nr:PBP1A family penicillin-binding protein [Verrucomicrobiales bacterium]
MSRKSPSQHPTDPPGPFAGLFQDSQGSGRSPGKKGGCLRGFLILCIIIVGVSGLTYLGGTAYYGGKALTFDLDKLDEVPERTLVYDRENKVLGHVSGHGENRLVVPASEVSDHFIKALLAREDSRFYEHGGVDYRGVVRAAIKNIKSGGMEQGASTLTMQLARNAFEMREKTLNRKLLEVALAKRIERNFDKEEILGFYMNRIYFGSGLYGIERASQGFFMKPASELNAGEGAMLAGIIRGPSLLNPFRSIESAKDTRDEVIARMVAEGTLTEEQSIAARSEEIVLRPPDKRYATGSYILQTVFDLLSRYLDSEEEVKYGGLRVYTTLDSNLQAAAEKSLDSHLTSIENRSDYRHPKRSQHKKGESTKYLQGSVVTLDNSSGATLALVGGRNFGDSSFNRAYQAKRQAGSTFKPFVYAVAMDRGGMLPGVYVSDDAIRLQHNGGPVWSPKNSDGTFTGLQPAAIGLIRSRNTMSVRVGQIAGINNVRSLAQTLKFGEIPDSPVIFLGAFDTTPFTMTSAMSTFGAKGVNYTPYLIERIEHRDGRVLFQNEVKGASIFPESVAWVTSDILSKVMDEGTGRSARTAGYTAPAYGKTGTTNDYRDAWFVGYSDKITTGVWVGLDQPKKIMDRGYGSTLALPIWTEVMKAAEKDHPSEGIPAPAGSTQTTLCRECGLLQSNRTRNPYQMLLPAEMRPRSACRGHGGGIFSNNRGLPQAFPIPGEMPAQLPPGMRPPEEESGLGKAIRGLGRFIFGGDPQR